MLGYVLSKLGRDFYKMVFVAGWSIEGFTSSWMSSNEARQLLFVPGAMASATIDQLAKLLTVFAIAERFTDETLAYYFEKGTLLAMAKRAEALLAEAHWDDVPAADGGQTETTGLHDGSR